MDNPDSFSSTQINIRGNPDNETINFSNIHIFKLQNKKISPNLNILTLTLIERNHDASARPRENVSYVLYHNPCALRTIPIHRIVFNHHTIPYF